jgi:hypothetical protein
MLLRYTSTKYQYVTGTLQDISEIKPMAEQKVDPNRPKDDQAVAGTSNLPLATPPVDQTGEALPLGPETLEAQREAFKKAEEAAEGEAKDNPLQTAGVEADVQNALQNPEASGQEDKEDVKAQAAETKKDVKAQAKEVKAQQAEQKDAEQKGAAKPAPGVKIALPKTSAQPSDAPDKSAAAQKKDAKK